MTLFGFVEPALSQQDAGACLVHLRNATLVFQLPEYAASKVKMLLSIFKATNYQK